MDSPTEQHHQEIGSQTLESMLACTKAQQDKKPRPPDQQALKCPRCDSANTKFCYYNNYSLTQPRYFCKSCRRYWTKGGTLRNVPVGGGCRKNKRSSSSSSSSTSSSSKRIQDNQLITPTHTPTGFSPLPYDSTDLSLAFARLQHQTAGGHLGFEDFSMFGMNPNNDNNNNMGFDLMGNLGGNGHGFLESIKTGFVESSSANGFQNLYYGDHNLGSSSYGENGNVGGEMGIGSLTVKQEGWNINGGRDQGENRVLWGFPWQGIGGGGAAGDGNFMAGGSGGDIVLDSGRQSWNGINPTNWHGLINSPLM